MQVLIKNYLTRRSASWLVARSLVARENRLLLVSYTNASAAAVIGLVDDDDDDVTTAEV